MAGTCVANNSGQLSAAVRKYTKAVGSRRAALKAPPALHLLSSSVTLPLLPTTSVIVGSQVKTNQELVISGENVIIDSLSLWVFIDVLQLTLSSLVWHSGEIYPSFLGLKTDLYKCYYFLQNGTVIKFNLVMEKYNVHDDEEVNIVVSGKFHPKLLYCMLRNTWRRTGLSLIVCSRIPHQQDWRSDHIVEDTCSL